MFVLQSEKKLYLDRGVIHPSLPLLDFCRFLKGRTAGDRDMVRRGREGWGLKDDVEQQRLPVGS